MPKKKGRRTKRLMAVRAERAYRLEKVQAMMLGGEMNQQQIAAALHVMPSTIHTDIKRIEEGWMKEETTKELGRKRDKRIRQLSMLFQKHLGDYEISRRTEVESTTTYREQRCDVCQGRGIKKGTEKDWCGTCGGDGTVKMEITTQRQIGGAGDYRHLEAARKCLVQMAKLEGLYVERIEETGTQAHMHFHAQADDRFAGASSEAIIEAMESIERLRLSSRQRVIEAEGYNEKEGEPDDG